MEEKKPMDRMRILEPSKPFEVDLQSGIRTLSCRALTLGLGHQTLIMGIVNTTPDSFSDGGELNTTEAVVKRAEQMIEAGADIIDIGGESTRPGAAQVELEEELRRVVPAIEALIKAGIQVPISIDTYKAEVAKQALDAGAHIVNDVWGLRRDPLMASMVAKYECPIIIMHNRKNGTYDHLINDIIDEMKESIDIAHVAGVSDEMILLDPGIGFAKNIQENLQLMKSLSEIVSMGYPVVLGTSRKRMIQKTLDRPAQDVLEGTAATVALGIAQGCQIIRVHDVAEMKKVALMADAIMRQ